MTTKETHYERQLTTGAHRHRGSAKELVRLLGRIDPANAWAALPTTLGAAPSAVPIAPELKTPMGSCALITEVVAYYLERQSSRYACRALLSDPDFGRFCSWLINTAGFSPPDTMTIVTMVFQMLAHEAAGKRVYDVHPALAEQLQNTELRGLTVDDLRLPYENVYITVPDNIGLEIWNADTGWHKAEGVYVTEERTGSTLRTWRFLWCGEMRNKDPLDDALVYFNVELEDGQSVDAALDAEQAKVLREMSTDEAVESFRQMMDKWRRLFVWAMNVVLYCTWTDPGEHILSNPQAAQLWAKIQSLPRKGSRRAMLQQKFKNMDARSRIILAPKTTIDRSSTPSEHSGSQHVVSSAWVRTRVAGHWRKQACGPRHSERKVIWIAPFWRGPEDAPIHTPKHEVR
jgi:hypothetical protein